MNANDAARLLLIGGDDALAAALAAHCAGGDIARSAAADALEYLQRNAAAPPRLIAVDAGGVDAVAVTAAIKGDVRFRILPLLVFTTEVAQCGACYDAGANACVVRPSAGAALQETAAALVGFWLGANEIPPGAL